ncbi:MAG: hypothetical protein ABL970_14225 [Nitrospira sp.]
MTDHSTYWPKSLAHLAEPYDDGVSDHVVIAEVNDALLNGNKGIKSVCTALVPLDELDEILSAPGGIGWEVESWGPHPCVDQGRVYDTRFWVNGRKGRDEKFQTIINGWKHHNQEVLLPDNVMLMAYGLIPRNISDGTVCWDDPQAPVYDVLRVRSHVDYGRRGDKLPQITMRRDYLEDYCSLKSCGAVAVYYEERFSSADDTFDKILHGEEGKQLELPGRLLGMAVLKGSYYSAAPQFARVWGCRLMLRPKSRPISNAKDPELVWPGDTSPMTLPRASQTWVYGYVTDEVLREYESRPEFDVQPESGGVSYNGWWATSYSYRIGRSHIRIELKKLYEGCPPHVITHWHKYAVPREVAEQDCKLNGDRNISVRAKDVIFAYLRVTKSLEHLSDHLGAGFTQEEIGSFVTEKVKHSGWWTPSVVKPLTMVVSLSASHSEFLGRATALSKVLENLKPAPVRSLAIQLGLEKDKIIAFGSIKLLASVCQLSIVTREQGHAFPSDAHSVVSAWNPEFRIAAFDRVFALQALRGSASHAPSAEQDKKMASLVGKFGIDVAATATGWGYAIDALYDKIAEDLNSIAEILSPR